MEIMEIGRIEIFAFLLKVPVVAAYMGPYIVDGAAVIRPQVFAGAPEFNVPFPVMIDKDMNVPVRQIPPDVVVIGL